MIEKTRKKVLGIVVTGGEEGTEKENHRGHRGGKEGADTLVRPCKARHWVEQRAVGKGAQGRLESRPQARKPAPHRTRHGGHGEKQTTEDTEDTQKSKPRRTRRTRRKTNHGGHGGG
jgi:hypothetical protein